MDELSVHKSKGKDSMQNDAVFPLMRNSAPDDEASLEMQNDVVVKTTLGIHQQYIAYKKTNRKGEDVDDSSQMKRVKGWLEKIDQVLGSKINPDPVGYKKQIQRLRELYDMLIHECDFYLNYKMAGLWGVAKNRKDFVRSIKAMAQAERSHFQDLETDREYFENRIEGALVGWNLSNQVRDYQAATEKEYRKFTLEGAVEDGVLSRQGDDFVGIHKDLPSTMEFIAKPGVKDQRITDEVGSSRVARFIGAGDLVQYTKMTLIKDREGKYHYGREKDKVDPDVQKTFEELQDGEHRILYTMDAIRQLSRIKLFSLLLGRKGLDEKKDILFTYSQEENGHGQPVYRITGAVLKGEVTKGEHAFSSHVDMEDLKGQILNLHRELGIDEDMSVSIQMMTENDIRYIASDLLTKEQIKAFNTRLSYMKSILGKIPAIGESKGKNDEATGWNTERCRNNLSKRLRNNVEDIDTFPGLFPGDAFELSLNGKKEVKKGKILLPPLLEDNKIRLSVSGNIGKRPFILEDRKDEKEEDGVSVEQEKEPQEEEQKKEQKEEQEKEPQEEEQKKEQKEEQKEEKEEEKELDESVSSEDDAELENGAGQYTRYEDHVYMEKGKINYIDNRFFGGEGHYMKKLKRVLNDGLSVQFDEDEDGSLKALQHYTDEDIKGLPETSVALLDRIQEKMEKIVSVCKRYRYTHLWPLKKRGQQRKAEVIAIEAQARDRIEACKKRRAEILKKYSGELEADTTSPFGRAGHGWRNAWVWLKAIGGFTFLNAWSTIGMAAFSVPWLIASPIKSLVKRRWSSAFHIPFPRFIIFWYRHMLENEAAALRKKDKYEKYMGIEMIRNSGKFAPFPWHTKIGMVGCKYKRTVKSSKGNAEDIGGGDNMEILNEDQPVDNAIIKEDA